MSQLIVIIGAMASSVHADNNICHACGIRDPRRRLPGARCDVCGTEPIAIEVQVHKAVPKPGGFLLRLSCGHTAIGTTGDEYLATTWDCYLCGADLEPEAA